MTDRPKISSYFTEESFLREKKTVFNSGLSYAGHRLMVPKQNDYKVVKHSFDRYTLFNNSGEYNLLSNICPHRQAQLLTGSGNCKNFNCKLHNWTFDNLGKLKSAPHFTDSVEVQLDQKNLFEWNGLLFQNKAPVCNLKESGLENYINFKDYFYAGTESENYPFNWKTFIEIYLENYHVFTMHPGLKKYVNPSDLEWVFGDDFSIQKVGIGKDLQSSGTSVYKEWQDHITKNYQNKELRYGAIWMLIYPNIMVEWYPDILVISTIYPTGARTCVNHVEFYYPSELYKNDPDYFHKEKKAYMETAIEDNEACQLLEKGRYALYQNDEELYGPIDSFLEAGVSSFYDYLSRR